MSNFHYEIADSFNMGYGLLAFNGANVLNYGADDWSLTEQLPLGALPGYLVFDPKLPINGTGNACCYSSEYGRIYDSDGELQLKCFPKTHNFTGGFYEKGSEIEEFVKETIARAAASKREGDGNPQGEAGSIVMESMTMDGETLDAGFLEEMRINYSIRLNGDHTPEINTDTLLTGTRKNGQLQYQEDGEEVFNEYELQGDVLTVKADGGAVLLFRRSPAELKAIYPKPGRDDESRALSEKVQEEVRDEYFGGTGGELYMDTENIRQYYWCAEGSDHWEYIKVSFQDYGSGIKTAGGIGASLPD